MKSLKRSDIEALRKELPVLTEKEKIETMGGDDTNDCWWRCMAYIKGLTPTAENAMALASGYYGSNFDENNYAFSGNFTDFQNYISGYVTCETCGSYCSTKLLVFDPTKVSGWEGVSGISHTVIVEGYSSSGDKVNVYCPQTGVRTSIDTTVLNPNPATGASGAGQFYLNVN